MTQISIAPAPTEVVAPVSMRSGVWKRFRRHPGAIVGSLILGLLALLVLLAPLSPYDPEISSM